MNLQLRMPSGVRWSGTLLVALALGAVAATILLVHLTALLLALLRPSAHADKVDVSTALATKTEATSNRKRFEGRYLFFPP